MLFKNDDNLRFPWLGATIGIILGVIVHLIGGSDDVIVYVIVIPFIIGFLLYLKKEKDKNDFVDKIIDDAFEKAEKSKKNL